MCDFPSTSRPCHPAMRRNVLPPRSLLPTVTTSPVWHTDDAQHHSKAWITYRPVSTPVLGFRQASDDPSDSGTQSGTGSSNVSPSASPSSPSDSGSASQSQSTQPPPSSNPSSSPPQSPSSQPQSSSPSSSIPTDTSSATPSSIPQQTSSSTQESSSSQPSTSSSSPLTTPSSSPLSTSSTSSPSPSPSPTPSSTPTPTSSTPTPTSSGAPSSPPPTTTPSTSSSITGMESTITSVFVTDINGSSTTVTTLIPTILSAPSSTPMSAGTRRAIITGSAIGGTVFLIIIAAMVIFCKRSSMLRVNYKKLRVFGHKQRSMLLDEDEDYDLADPPGMHRLSDRYTDNPYTASMDSRASSRTQGAVPPFPVASLPGSSSPHLLGLRASESGSIFREAVWPPPGEQSRLVDPLVAGSNSVDLGRIIGDVMGPSASNMPPTPGHPSTSQSGLQPSVAIATGAGSGVHSRQTSATRLLSSPNFQYPSNPDPPGYYDYAGGEHEADLARAQSPDSQVYTERQGPLRIANVGPESPSTPTFTPPGTPKVKNWLERSPKTLHKETEEPQQGTEHVVMGEAL